MPTTSVLPSSARRVLKRIFELEPYAKIEKPTVGGDITRWVFIHRKSWAADLIISPRTISRSLETLEAAALIERHQAFQSRGYGREIHVRLTADGRDLAEELGSNKLLSRQDQRATVTGASCRHDSSKLPAWQHLSRLEKTRDTDLQEEKEILLHSPNGDCRFGEERVRERNEEKAELEDEGDAALEAQLDRLFRDCFTAAFPNFRPQTATHKSLRLISDLAREVRAGEWTLREIEDTWSRIFPMWWRFVTATGVRSYDRQRPDRFGAVTYLSEMHNYLLDHARILEEEEALGPLAPSALRRTVHNAYDELGGVRGLLPRDPDDPARQLQAMAEELRDHGITTEEGIRFVVRIACFFGRAGREGTKYWTPDYENIGMNGEAYLAAARQARNEPSIKEWASACVRGFADRVLQHIATQTPVDEYLNAAMDEATRVAVRINIGKGDPIKLFKDAYGLGMAAFPNATNTSVPTAPRAASQARSALSNGLG